MSVEAILFLVFLAVSFLIGALASRYVENLSDYFVAGARMPWFFIAGTFIASNVSTGLFLGATNMTGLHGYSMWSAYVTTSIGFLLGIAVIGVLVRRLSTHYEVLDFADILAVRYSSRSDAIRVLITIILPVVYIPLLAAQLIGLATIASGMFEMPYHTVLTVITAVVIAYTMLGGMLGVVWSDGFQFIVLMLGLLLAVPLAMTEFGAGDAARGWELLRSKSDHIFNHTTEGWTWYLILGQFAWIFAIPVQPHLVTRFLTARSEKHILIALPVCLTAGVIIYTSTVPLGLLGQAANSATGEEGYAYIALARNLLSPWIGAFALAGVAAAALSTCSTVLIVTGQSLSREVYQKLLSPDASERSALMAARVAVLLVGAVTFAIAYLELLGIFWLVVLSASLLASVFFVPIFAGFFSTRAGATGAIASMIAGGTAAIIVYAVNRQFGTNIFINELFAGLFFSALAMWIANRKFPATPAEQSVPETLGLH